MIIIQQVGATGQVCFISCIGSFGGSIVNGHKNGLMNNKFNLKRRKSC
jgi:hypothetical protein